MIDYVSQYVYSVPFEDLYTTEILVVIMLFGLAGFSFIFIWRAYKDYWRVIICGWWLFCSYFIPWTVDYGVPFDYESFYMNQIGSSVFLASGLSLISYLGKQYTIQITLLIILTTLFAIFNYIVQIGYISGSRIFFDSYSENADYIQILEILTLMTMVRYGYNTSVGRRTASNNLSVLFNKSTVSEAQERTRARAQTEKEEISET